MPGTTGSRTPSAPDRGVCTISQSDLVGHTGNALTRIKELEQRVAELESKIVQTSQLSNISQQVGWVTLPSYLGQTGWTQTSYGTLIPPAGFYLGDIIPGYSGGLIGANGEVILGLGDDGTLGGFLGGVGKADIYYGADQITYSSSPETIKKFTNLIVTDSDGLVTTAADGKVTFASTGYYMVQTTIEVDYPVAAGANKKFLHGLGEGSGWYSELFQEEEVTGQSGIYNFINCCVFRNDGTPNFFYIQVADTGVASGTRTCDIRQMAIIKLASL